MGKRDFVALQLWNGRSVPPHNPREDSAGNPRKNEASMRPTRDSRFASFGVGTFTQQPTCALPSN